MNPAEVADFLAAGRTMIIGSHNPDGSIHLAPMWYAVVDGAPVVWTYARSQKALNLARDPRVTALVEDGDLYDRLRGVQLVGEATIFTDPAEVLRVGTVIHRKYAGRDGADLPEVLRQQAAKRIAVRIETVRTASWDHRKLGGGY